MAVSQECYIHAMDMRLAPLDTSKTEVCKFVWEYCDNPIRFGAMSPRTQPICVNLVYVGDFVWPYLKNAIYMLWT